MPVCPAYCLASGSLRVAKPPNSASPAAWQRTNIRYYSSFEQSARASDAAAHAAHELELAGNCTLIDLIIIAICAACFWHGVWYTGNHSHHQLAS